MTNPTPPRRGPTPTKLNHYVAEWYQRRFLTPGSTRFRYLDLRPEKHEGRPGQFYHRAAVLPWGPGRCFAQEHLYTLKFGRVMTDAMEHGFFKSIDDGGLLGVPYFAQFGFQSGFEEAWHGLMAFMDAQRYRTPRGLDHLKKIMRVDSNNALLIALERIFQYNATMWTEGIWEIVNATNSPTKFLLTDNPVTFYNERAFPGGPLCSHPNDARLHWIGTRTIFPLDLDHCLIITHREWTRNPWKNPLHDRINARAYQMTTFNALQVQTDRELQEDEVLRINLILKRRADRYVAACNEEWLYPERRASVSLWSKVDHDWFLMPNLYELSLGGAIAVGYKDGSSSAWDEYGRHRSHPDYDKHERDEARLYRLARLEWGSRRIGKSIGLSHEFRHTREQPKPVWDGHMLEEVEKYIRSKKRPRGLRSRPPGTPKPYKPEVEASSVEARGSRFKS